MTYRPTLLNIASVALMVIDTYVFFTSDVSGETKDWGVIALILSFAIGCFGLLIDFILQRIVKNYWIITGVELIVLMAFGMLFLWNTRKKTIIIPDDYIGPVTIVYGVENTQPLPRPNLLFRYHVEIPETGILFTKTFMTDDLWNTAFQTKSGQAITKRPSNKYVIDNILGEYNCQQKLLRYRTWWIAQSNKKVDGKYREIITLQKIQVFCETNR